MGVTERRVNRSYMEEQKIKKSSYEPVGKLWIWKEAIELHRLIDELLKETKGQAVGKKQMDRSSQSVPDNIAEMHGAFYFEVKLNSLRIARKEAYETINHIKKFEIKRVWQQNVCSNLFGRYNKLIFGINKYIKYVNETKEKFDSK